MSQIYLQAQNTDAPYLVFTEDGNAHPISKKVARLLNMDDPLMHTRCKEKWGSRIAGKAEERRKYYWLPLGYHNQPNGNVEEIELFPSDYKALKEAELKDRYPYWWIYEDYATALNRALD